MVENTSYTEEFVMTAALDPGRPFTGSERELLENTLTLNPEFFKVDEASGC
jgi:hypothetical protein